MRRTRRPRVRARLPYYLMLTKGLVDHGHLRIPNLGRPFSLELYDNPRAARTCSSRLRRGLGFFRRDAALTSNVYYLLTFVAVGLAAWFFSAGSAVAARRRGHSIL